MVKDKIKPNNTITGILLLLLLYVSPLYNLHGWTSENIILHLIAALIYIEINSGLFHIIFDNTKLNHLPIIGPYAIDFQQHHANPTKITKIPLQEFIQQVHGPTLLVTGSQIIITHENILLRPFWFFAIILSNFMFLAHRWAHIPPKQNNLIIQFLQNNNLLISMQQHKLHHFTYDCNFSIFTGWSNPALNHLTKYYIHQNSLLYIPLFIIVSFFPTIIETNLLL